MTDLERSFSDVRSMTHEIDGVKKKMKGKEERREREREAGGN